MAYFKTVDANALTASRTLYLKNVEVSYNKLLLVEVHCSILLLFLFFFLLSPLSHTLSRPSLYPITLISLS